ncbi:MAG: SGNH/GDSL hydrolase family protein [Myxococcota bacterium]
MLAGCPAPDDPDMNADSTSASSGAAGSSGSASPATTTAANDESSAGEDSASTSDGPDSGGSSGGTPGGSNDTDTMLAIGDSVLEWNAERGASIPEVAGELAGLAVTNASVSGAMLLEDEESIPSQYQPSDWEWVLVNGGANDVGDGCGCGDCVGQVDAIISADVGDGAMVELIDRIEADGAGIVLLGYYDIPPGEFSDCDEEFAILHERYAQLASQRPAVLYVSMGDAIDPLADPETLDEDQIHPSVQGSAAIGALIAERIQP